MQVFSDEQIKEIRAGIKLGEKAEKVPSNNRLFKWQVKALDLFKGKSRHDKTGKGKKIREAITEKFKDILNND